MIREILYRAKVGGDKALAAARGDGKTSIAEGVILFCILSGLLKFPVVVAATGPHAARILDEIKNEVEQNDLLAEDFPEVCHPVRVLERSWQRANRQTHNGKPTDLRWGADIVVFPRIDKSKASGAVLRCFGLDAALRGLSYRGRRPDFVLIDDPETPDSAAHSEQVRKRERSVDRDIAGMAGQGRKLGRLALVTLQNRTCLAARLTDPRIKPSWGGRRFGAIKQWPTNNELWDEYIDLVRVGGETGEDPDARQAMQLYLDNREAMDEGAIVSNENNFLAEPLPDGTATEVSALQHCYNVIARIGMDAFLTEYQNDPAAEDEPTTSGITSALVGGRISGLGYRELPFNTVALTAFCDVGDHALHWAMTAWLKECWGTVVDYGTVDVRRVGGGTDKQQTLERSIVAALHTWRLELQANLYATPDGVVKDLDLGLIDSGSGLHQRAVYEFIRDVKGRPFAASKGFGQGYRTGKPIEGERRVGDGWAIVKQAADALWLYEFDSSYWKKFSHQRFLTSPFDENNVPRPGALSLFICPDAAQFAKDRREFTHQVTNEIWTVTPVPGKAEKAGWVKRGKNHWLDAIAGCCVGANMCGVRLTGVAERAASKPAPMPQQFRTPAGQPFLLSARSA